MRASTTSRHASRRMMQYLKRNLGHQTIIANRPRSCKCGTLMRKLRKISLVLSIPSSLYAVHANIHVHLSMLVAFNTCSQISMGRMETHVSKFPTIGKHANSPIRPQLFYSVDLAKGYQKHVFGIEFEVHSNYHPAHLDLKGNFKINSCPMKCMLKGLGF